MKQQLRYVLFLLAITLYPSSAHAQVSCAEGDVRCQEARVVASCKAGVWEPVQVPYISRVCQERLRNAQMNSSSAQPPQPVPAQAKVEPGETKILKNYQKCPQGAKKVVIRGRVVCRCTQPGWEIDTRALDQAGKPITACRPHYKARCNTDRDCHTLTPFCRVGFGDNDVVGYRNRRVCVSARVYKHWHKMAFLAKATSDQKRYVFRGFTVGKFQKLSCKRAVKKCGYKQCWKKQSYPVTDTRFTASNQAAANRMFTQLQQIKKHGGGYCPLEITGLVDYNAIRPPCFKGRHNEPTKRDIHLRLGRARAKALASYVRQRGKKLGVRIVIRREDAKVSDKTSKGGKDRKVEVFVRCEFQLHTEPPAPARPPEWVPPTTIRVQKEQKVVFKNLQLRLAIFGTGRGSFDALPTDFSLTGGIGFTFLFMKHGRFRGGVAAGASINHSPWYPIDFMFYFEIGGAPADWIELYVGYTESDAGTIGDANGYTTVRRGLSLTLRLLTPVWNLGPLRFQLFGGVTWVPYEYQQERKRRGQWGHGGVKFEFGAEVFVF